MVARDILIVYFGGHPSLDSMDRVDEKGGVKPKPFILSKAPLSSLTPSNKDSKGQNKQIAGLSRQCWALPAGSSPLSKYSDI